MFWEETDHCEAGPLGPLGFFTGSGRIKQESTWARISRGPFYGKSPNSKIFGAARTGPDFRARFFRAQAKNQNSAPNILSAPSSGFRNGRTRPRRPKILGGDRFPVKPIFPGPSPARNIPGYGSRAQKLLARSVGAPENFGHIRCPVQKLRHFFSVTDGQTHRHIDAQTFPNDPCTTRGETKIFLPICG